MPSNGPLNTPFETPLVSTPGPGEATTAGITGGFELDDNGKPGLVSSPFENPFATAPSSQKETPNRSELPTQITTTGNIKDAPARGAHVGVAEGVTSPATPNTTLGQK